MQNVVRVIPIIMQVRGQKLTLSYIDAGCASKSWTGLTVLKVTIAEACNFEVYSIHIFLVFMQNLRKIYLSIAYLYTIKKP